MTEVRIFPWSNPVKTIPSLKLRSTLALGKIFDWLFQKIKSRVAEIVFMTPDPVLYLVQFYLGMSDKKRHCFIFKMSIQCDRNQVKSLP